MLAGIVLAVYSHSFRFARSLGSLVAVPSIISRQSSESAVNARPSHNKRKKLEENSTRKRTVTATFFRCTRVVEGDDPSCSLLPACSPFPASLSPYRNKDFHPTLSRPLETMILARFPLWVSPRCLGTASFFIADSVDCDHVCLWNFFSWKAASFFKTFLDTMHSVVWTWFRIRNCEMCINFFSILNHLVTRVQLYISNVFLYF